MQLLLSFFLSFSLIVSTPAVFFTGETAGTERSEERRVGKECP